MNMAVELERAYPEVEKRSHGPQTVVGRLREWSRARHYPALNCWPPESPMYAVLRSPGRATNTSQDGGLAAMMDRLTGAEAAHIRAVEAGRAIYSMPTDARAVVLAMYDVPKLERPRSVRDAAAMCGLKKTTYEVAMARALGWLSNEMGLPAI